MSEETKEYIRLHMEILKESMKKEGLFFAIAINKEDFDNSRICIVDRDKFVENREIDGIMIRLDELNKGLL